MRLIGLGGLRLARLWEGALPDLSCAPVKAISLSASGLPASDGDERRFAVELYIPRGPVNQYGLLGAVWEPAKGEQLQVDIATCDADGPRIEWALAQSGDEVTAGIPSWAAEPITEAVQVAEAVQSLRAGTLSFVCGAHGAVGSSPEMFGHLAKTILGLLASEEPLTDDAFKGVVQEAFS